MSTTTRESSLMRASSYLLQYLHDETKAVWAVTSHPIGTHFPIFDAEGAPMAYLSIASDEQYPAAYEQIGTAVAAALGVLGSLKSTPRSYDISSDTSLLDATLMRGRVIAYFQPIVELSTGNVVALESLARWQTVDGVLSPDAFLRTIESAGLLFELFERMVDESLQFLADYRHRMPDLSVAVNLELGMVPEMGLRDLLLELLAKHEVRPDLLTIELNDRLGNEISLGAIHELREVAGIGVNLMASDFTTTEDLIDRLVGVPIAGAKIDRRHVSQLTKSQEHRDLVRSIIERAQTTGLDIIAEGVETQTQREHLLRLGCSFGQGYYFAVPQSPILLDAVLQAPLATAI